MKRILKKRKKNGKELFPNKDNILFLEKVIIYSKEQKKTKNLQNNGLYPLFRLYSHFFTTFKKGKNTKCVLYLNAA